MLPTTGGGLALKPAAELPNFAQDLTAEFALAGFAIAHHAAAGADNRDAQTIEHRLQLGDAAINPPARTAHPLDMADHLLAVGSILEIQPQLVSRFGFHFFPVPDVALALEDIGQAALDFGGRQLHLGPLDPHGIPD